MSVSTCQRTADPLLASSMVASLYPCRHKAHHLSTQEPSQHTGRQRMQDNACQSIQSGKAQQSGSKRSPREGKHRAKKGGKCEQVPGVWAAAHSVSSGKREDRRENRSSQSVRSHPYFSGAREVYRDELHAVKKAAGLCRPSYPLCQRKRPGNLLQNPLRKVEQLHTLQGRTAISLSLMLSTRQEYSFAAQHSRYEHICTCCSILVHSNDLGADQSVDSIAGCRLRTQGRTKTGASCLVGASRIHSLPSAWWTLSSSFSAEGIAT